MKIETKIETQELTYEYIRKLGYLRLKKNYKHKKN